LYDQSKGSLVLQVRGTAATLHLLPPNRVSTPVGGTGRDLSGRKQFDRPEANPNYEVCWRAWRLCEPFLPPNSSGRGRPGLWTRNSIPRLWRSFDPAIFIASIARETRRARGYYLPLRNVSYGTLAVGCPSLCGTMYETPARGRSLSAKAQ
jgi:hypothetical protein